ncbi:MAG: hypothetical protein OER56_11335 [Hyphomicrobiales bacterium]|nr:hypothetical protein [Hyphomicrobiales bacterium]
MGRVIGNGNISRINAGTPLNDGTASRSLSVWHLVTNDLATAVEAANFFDALAESMEIGDVIHASLDVDGTPKFKTYGVSDISAAGVVTVIRSVTTAG